MLARALTIFGTFIVKVIVPTVLTVTVLGIPVAWVWGQFSTNTPAPREPASAWERRQFALEHQGVRGVVTVDPCESVGEWASSGKPLDEEYDRLVEACKLARGARNVPNKYLATKTYESLPPGGGRRVVCRDGWVSYSGGKRGACSHHGGIP